MNARTKQFWLFQAIFWSIAGAALFISGATQMPVYQALVRNLFLLIAGFLSSFFIAMVIDELRWLSMVRLRIVSYALAYLVAVFCVVVINAISFTLRGVALGDLAFGQWFSGALNLGLIYAFWSELFIQQVYFEQRSDTRTVSAPDSLVVEHRGAKMQVPLADIESITAAGDYVEINTNGRSYLNRQTLHALEQLLGDRRFVRIHRSTLVNRDHVQAVTPLRKGRYQLQFLSGATVTSSRGYRETVREYFLATAA